MSVYQNISDGKYEPKMAYPDKPIKTTVMPFLLRPDQKAKEQAKYEVDLAVYRTKSDEWREEAAHLKAVFFDDLCAHFEVPRNHEFGKAMIELAWEAGHSNGYSEVTHEFVNLLKLWSIATKLGMRTSAKRKVKK